MYNKDFKRPRKTRKNAQNNVFGVFTKNHMKMLLPIRGSCNTRSVGSVRQTYPYLNRFVISMDKKSSALMPPSPTMKADLGENLLRNTSSPCCFLF